MFIYLMLITLYMRNKLREYRARQNLTKDDLAKKAGVTRQTIIAIENERYNPSLELAFKLSKVFRTKIEDLFEN